MQSTVALHARWAEGNEAERVLKSARRIANKWIDSIHTRILGGFSIGVDTRYPLLQADEHLASSDSVRAWLAEMIIAGR